MSRNSYVLLFILHFIAIWNVNAQKTYILDTLYPVHELDPHLEIIADPDLKFTIDQMRSDSTQEFHPIGDLPLSYDPFHNLPQNHSVSACYWARINIQANGNTEGWQLHLEDRMLGIAAWGKGNGEVDVFAFDGNKELFHRRSGTNLRSDEKDIPEQWNLDKVNFTLPKGKTTQMFIRIQGNNAGVAPYFNASIRSPSTSSIRSSLQNHRKKRRGKRGIFDPFIG